MSKITPQIHTKVSTIIDEMNQIILDRWAVIHGFWVARVGQLHIVMLGPGGTGKTLLARNAQDRIIDGFRFETALDETTDPSRVFGPVDVKALAEHGKSRVVTTGMLPEATDAFIDEIMNANAPVKHSLQPILNERVFHNNGMPNEVPLRTMVAGTNNNNADTDPSLAPFFDRLHLRYTVDYVANRDQQANMVAQAIARMATVGRGMATSIATTNTTVSLSELDQAHKEALDLDVEDAVMETFLDLRDELRGKGIMISDRRMVEGMAAVLSNAWVRGHDSVQVGDLDILTGMWWSLQEHAGDAKAIILSVTNPGEKAALDLLDGLDKLKGELANADASNVDDEKKRRIGIEAVRNTDKLLKDAAKFREEAVASGAGTQRLDEVIGKANAFKLEVGRKVFNIDPAQMAAMANA